MNFNGATGCCDPVDACEYSNPWYSQCKPQPDDSSLVTARGSFSPYVAWGVATPVLGLSAIGFAYGRRRRRRSKADAAASQSEASVEDSTKGEESEKNPAATLVSAHV